MTQPGYPYREDASPQPGQPASPYLGSTPTYGSPAGYYAGLAPSSTYNPWAIASLVLGLLGTAILAVIAGHVALSQIGRTGERGTGLAIAGLVLGYLEIVGYAILIVALIGLAGMSSG